MLIFIFFSSFFIFFIPHYNVMHKVICVKDFSGTTAPRILQVDTKIGYDLFYYVRDNQYFHAYHSLYLSIFSLEFSFSSHISQLL